VRKPRLPKPARSPEQTRAILRKLQAQHPGADTELHYTTPYELLVATILSAQCTDERVNQVTPALFRRYPDATALHAATPAELEPQIQSTGFFRAKSKSLAGMAAAVVARHGGEIPRTMDDLTALPGVGRKTANVVLGHALGVPGYRSIGTCCACRTGSASRAATIRKSSNSSCARRCRPPDGRRRPTR
jgi:endonuclease-3